MKGEAVYKRTYNRLIIYLGELKIGDALDSENVLKSKLDASRTTIRKVLRDLELKKLITIESTKKFLCRRPKVKDSFPRAETLSNAARIEKKFLEWMLRADPKPGDIINELELARQFGVSTSGIREFLNRFSRFKLIERRPNSGWCFQGFTEDFALELFEVRELFEMRSATAFATLPDDAIAWTELKALEIDHKNLLRNIKKDFHNFSDMDERFHQLVNNASMNRFIVDFYDLISLIFHYHYQWNKVDERKRNQAAILEHLAYIEALFSRDPKRIELACKKHFVSARITLLSSIKG
jgi:DNA-binding GntR family transcriptional regulator